MEAAAAAAVRKRGRPDMTNGEGGAKRSKEMESFQSGLGSKSKPCTKFFSTTGCPFGEGCHFLHYVPGGYQAVAKMLNLGNPALTPPGRVPMDPVAAPNAYAAAPTIKTRLCSKYNTAEGCKFGDKCHFAHGERELGKNVHMSQEGTMPPALGGRFGGRPEPPAPAALAPPSSFGASATAKISVDASLAGAIIGKGGVNTKHICRVTGVKLSIREHESDPNLKNIELEGNFDQIKQASTMVGDLIVRISSAAPAAPGKKHAAAVPVRGGGGNNYKTKLCENFAKGTCTFGDRCHFAHGAGELRKGVA